MFGWSILLTGFGLGTGFNVQVTDGTNTNTVRIDFDIDLFHMAPPLGTFDITGIGYQYDTSDPFTDGYQLQPRFVDDVMPYIPNTNLYPLYTIEEVRSVGTDGVADSLGVACTLRGIVHGLNLTGSGLQFTIIENGYGISVYSSSNHGYIVTEGDDVTVRGFINQFAGLAEIEIISLDLNSSGNSLQAPVSVTSLDESTESAMIKLEGLTYVDPTDWDPGTFGFTVRLTDGTSTFNMRIDNNVDIYDCPIIFENSTINVTGIGGQFDNSNPYTSGYQIVPRYKSDIELVSSVEEEGEEKGLSIHPNPTRETFVLESDKLMDAILIYDINGRIIIEQKIADHIAFIEIDFLPKGTYILHVKQSERTIIEKVVVQ